MAIVTSNQFSSLRERYKATNSNEASLANQSNNIYTDSEDSGEAVVDELTGQLNTSEYDGAPDSKFVVIPDANQTSAVIRDKGVTRISPISDTQKNAYYNSTTEIDPLNSTIQTTEYSAADQVHVQEGTIRPRGGGRRFGETTGLIVDEDYSQLDDLNRNTYDPGSSDGTYLDQFTSQTGVFGFRREARSRTFRGTELGGETSS